MCKITLILLVCSFYVATAEGQSFKKWNKDSKYEAGIEMTTSLPFFSGSNTVFALETCHGSLMGDNFFAGGGIGFRSLEISPRVIKYDGSLPADFTLSREHKYNFTVFVQLDFRFNKLRKIRKHFIPYGSAKLIYLFHNKSSDDIQISYGGIREIIYTSLYPECLAEVSIGGELVSKGLPRLYIALGYEVTRDKLEGKRSYVNEGEELHIRYKIAARPSLNLKIGIRL